MTELISQNKNLIHLSVIKLKLLSKNTPKASACIGHKWGNEVCGTTE